MAGGDDQVQQLAADQVPGEANYSQTEENEVSRSGGNVRRPGQKPPAPKRSVKQLRNGHRVVGREVLTLQKLR